jgi:hypothetical protein
MAFYSHALTISVAYDMHTSLCFSHQCFLLQLLRLVPVECLPFTNVRLLRSSSLAHHVTSSSQEGGGCYRIPAYATSSGGAHLEHTARKKGVDRQLPVLIHTSSDGVALLLQIEACNRERAAVGCTSSLLLGFPRVYTQLTITHYSYPNNIQTTNELDYYDCHLLPRRLCLCLSK